MASLQGSKWRRWDLHIHTPCTKLSNGYVGDNELAIWDKYMETLEASPVQAFGITDYFSCDNYFTLIEKYRAKYPDSKKVFFPNIEFRLAEAISLNNNNPHFHVIFDNNPLVCPKAEIDKFLATLKTLGETNSGVPISCADLQTSAQFSSASVSIEKLKEALKSTFGDSKPYLLGFPAKNDGVRSTDSNSPRKVLITDKIDKLSDLFFGDSSNKDYFLRYDRYESGESDPKPVTSGSDAHSFDDLERLEGNVSAFEPTWIKADLTFRGLQQICFEPEARVLIGSEPHVEVRKAQQATKFLAKLKINQISGYDEANGEWFKSVEIPLNSELVAIIGNKGSGKSALVDIIGLLGESKQEHHFSFLSNDHQNKKFKQRGYAENFVAELEWESSTKVSKSLDEKIDPIKPETVRYLPQNYFERLTNELEMEVFRDEIDDVVFSHVGQTDRLGKSTFRELQEFKTQQRTQETSALKASLRELNIEIVRLEDESDPLYRTSLEEQLKAKKAELDSLENEKTKQKEEKKPDAETDEQKELSEKINQFTELAKNLKDVGQRTTEAVSQKKNRLQKLTSLEQNLSAMGAQIIEQKQELKPVCEELDLNIEEIVTVEIKTDSIKELSLAVKTEIKALEKDNDLKFADDTDYNELKSIPDLHSAYAHIKEQIEKIKEQLGTPQRKYQAYLDKIAKWDAQRLVLIGSEEEPRPDTIRYLELQISYLDNQLPGKLLNAYSKRKEIFRKIFESKKQILIFYSDLKKSVETKLSDVRAKRFFCKY